MPGAGPICHAGRPSSLFRVVERAGVPRDHHEKELERQRDVIEETRWQPGARAVWWLAFEA